MWQMRILVLEIYEFYGEGIEEGFFSFILFKDKTFKESGQG